MKQRVRSKTGLPTSWFDAMIARVALPALYGIQEFRRQGRDVDSYIRRLVQMHEQNLTPKEAEAMRGRVVTNLRKELEVTNTCECPPAVEAACRRDFKCTSRVVVRR